MANYITFTKIFVYENILPLISNNENFLKEECNREGVSVFSYKNRLIDSESKYENFTYYSSQLYISGNFIFVNNTFQFDGNKIPQFSSNVFKFAHEKNENPANKIIEELFNLIKKDTQLKFIHPCGNQRKRKEFTLFQEYYDYCKSNANDTEVYSYVFYTFESNDKTNDEQYFKDATEGNSINTSRHTDISLTEINSDFSLYATTTGCGIIKTNPRKKVNHNYQEQFYYVYLDVLQKLIYFENKAKEFNTLLDNENYTNLDVLKINVRKEIRKAYNLKYRINNSLKVNDREEIFFGTYLTSVNFSKSLDEFIEICRSIEKELRAKIDEREEQHDKYFDKILSIVGIFAIISAFKDGSDLILSFIDSIKSGGLIHFDISSIINFLSPIVCLFLICILLKIFTKKK